MIATPYLCKICNQPGTAQADDDTPPEWITKLKKLLTCNPCYRYHTKQRKAHDWISDRAIEVLNIRAVFHEESDDELAMRLEPSRLSLVKGTKRYAQIVCKHHRHTYRWEPDLVDQIMEQPDKAVKILYHYERLVKSGKFK